VDTHKCTFISSTSQAIHFTVAGLVKECVAPASNKTLVGKVFTGNIPDTTASGSSLPSSASRKNTRPPASGFFAFPACWLVLAVGGHPCLTGAVGEG